MNRRWMVVLGSVLCSFRSEEPLPTVGVTFTRHSSSVQVSLSVDATDGETVFRFSEEWGGVEDPETDWSGFSAVDANGTALEVHQDEGRTLRVTHPQGTSLTLSYFLNPTPYQGNRDPRIHYRPILNERLFLGVGHLCFAQPDLWEDDDSLRVELRWEGFEEAGWPVMHSFGLGTHVKFVETWSQFSAGLFQAGEFLHEEREVFGETLHVTIAGDRWEWNNQEFADAAASIVEIQRDFFEDYEVPYYWISVIPVGEPMEQGMAFGGTGLSNCFALYLPPNAAIGLGTRWGIPLRRLLSHEMFHEWNGNTIQAKEADRFVTWFSEGFTDYYARRILRAGGWLDRVDYAKAINDRLREYFQNPLRDVSNQVIGEQYWSDPDIGQLPYQRGDVIAMIVDSSIRKTSGGERSLDDLMRELLQEARAGERISTQSLLDKFVAWTDADTVAGLSEVIQDGGVPRLSETVFSPEYQVSTVPVASFDLGFDSEGSMKEGRLVGVREGSTAYQAGLRSGQKVLGYSVENGKVDVPATVWIEGEHGERAITFLPQGARTLVPQILVESSFAR